MPSPALIAKAAAAILSDERTRKAAGWVLVAVLSPLILLIAFFCTLGSGASDHNTTAVELCFYGGTIPPETPEEYRVYIEENTKITLWQDEREYAALQAALTRNGTSVEAVMQEYLARLYCQAVSLEEQKRIGGEAQAEATPEAPQRDDGWPVSVFHIKEHGQDFWLRQREPTEFLQAANYLREYLSVDPQTRAASFAESLTSVDSITPREFRQLALERMENIGRVTFSTKSTSTSTRRRLWKRS